MKKAKKNTARQRLSQFLEIPLDTVANVPRVTLNDNCELTVENYKSIEGYEPEEIRLRSQDYSITVSGKNLQIVAITDEEILVRGTVSAVSLGM